MKTPPRRIAPRTRSFAVIHAEGPQPVSAVPPSVVRAANAPVRGRQQIVSSDPGKDWTIQIGAYANEELARAYLDAYAKKSIDVLGRAAQMVVPFRAQDGRTVYRARFGLFVERKAHQVCDRLAKHGDSCIVERNT